MTVGMGRAGGGGAGAALPDSAAGTALEQQQDQSDEREDDDGFEQHGGRDRTRPGVCANRTCTRRVEPRRADGASSGEIFCCARCARTARNSDGNYNVRVPIGQDTYRELEDLADQFGHASVVELLLELINDEVSS